MTDLLFRRAQVGGRNTLLPPLFTGLSLLLLMALTGCQHGTSAGNGTSSAGGGKSLVIHIGHQRADGLNLLQLRGDLDKRLALQGVTVQWLDFPAGPPLLEALNVGSLDIGSTGESPPLFAQAAGSSLVYIANIPLPADPGEGQALLIPKGSPLHTVADLKGKRIAVQKASGAHNFLIQAVEKAGLKYTDIHPVYLSPPDARVAFEAGSVDGWAIWDPYLTVAQQQMDARVLVDARGVITAGAFYLASQTFAKTHPELIKIILEEIDKAGVWASAHPAEAAQLLAKGTGIDAKTLELLQRKRITGSHYVGIHPIDEAVIQAQQTVADNYYRIGLLPKRLNVRQAMLTPQEYARLTPAASATRAAR